MAVPLFSQLLGSRLFKFTVGAEVDSTATEFSLHEDAVSWLSKPLEMLMKGGSRGKFSEAQAGATVWPDVRREIFECFAEFAYTCDYSIPKPVIRKIVEEIPVELTNSDVMPPAASENILDELQEVNWGLFKPQKKKGAIPLWPRVEKSEIAKLQASSGLRLAENFKALSYPLLTPRSRFLTCSPSLPSSKDFSYLDILFCHANLYILADLWMVDSLKALALFKLHATLCAVEVAGKNAGDIVALARYAYKEGKGSDEGIGGLRNLVCQYMASNVMALSLDQGFMDLLEEGGPLVRDLWRFEVQRH